MQYDILNVCCEPIGTKKKLRVNQLRKPSCVTVPTTFIKSVTFLIELFFAQKFRPHNLSIPHLDREGRRTLHDEGVAEVVSALS